MTLRAVHATMEKQIMLTESALSVEKELEKASADQLIYRSRHAREAETEAEEKLLRAIVDGNERAARILVRHEPKTDVVVCNDLDQRTTLHCAWDFWELKYGLTGAVQAVMKEDPRYTRTYRKLAEARRGGGMPRAEGMLVSTPQRDIMEPETAQLVRDSDEEGERFQVQVGAKVDRRRRCFDACCSTEYMVALVLQAARRKFKRKLWLVSPSILLGICGLCFLTAFVKYNYT